MSNEVSRRDVFLIAGGAGVAAAVPRISQAQTAPAATMPMPPAAPAHAEPHDGQSAPLTFFNQEQAAFITAAIDRLIPADDTWPGAVGCNVLVYLDRQLGGAYGAGDRLYLQGPWKSGTPQQGYQLPYTPAELYRTAMEGLFAHLKSNFGGRQFGQLDRAEQEKLLTAMERGELDLGPVPSAVFFETLLANTIEGFFADPAYGGNRDMAAWRMIGFPGAFAQYATMVEHHGMRFDRPPLAMSGAHDSHGEAHHHDHGAMSPERGG